MCTKIYFIRVDKNVTNMWEYPGRELSGKLLGELYGPCNRHDYATEVLKVPSDSPDIGDELGDPQPPGVRAVTVAHEGQPAYTIVFDPSTGAEPDPQPPEVSDGAARKGLPIARGVLDYFPSALLKVAEVSRVGNEQHNPGQPMHWAYSKSADHADALLRHLIDRRTVDSDGLPHVAKVAWRALALLQAYLEDQDPELHERMEKQRAAMKEGR